VDVDETSALSLATTPLVLSQGSPACCFGRIVDDSGYYRGLAPERNVVFTFCGTSKAIKIVQQAESLAAAFDLMLTHCQGPGAESRRNGGLSNNDEKVQALMYWIPL
jgi:hypothetical protein